MTEDDQVFFPPSREKLINEYCFFKKFKIVLQLHDYYYIIIMSGGGKPEIIDRRGF